VRELLGIMTARTRNSDERNGDTSESCRKFMIELLLFVLAIYCDAFLFYFAGASCIFAIITTSEYYF
jgi:hypothetical protein